MITNASITLYHRIKGRNPSNRFIRVNFADVWTFGGHDATLNKGLTDSDSLSVRIPYKQNDIDISKIKRGDLIVIGTSETDISAESDLDEYYVITSVKDNTFGEEPHVHLGAK